MKTPSPNRRKQNGFTLVELLVVVAIIAALVAIAIPLYAGSIKRSNVNVVKANVKLIANAALAYKASSTNDAWPASVAAMVGTAGQLPATPYGPSGVTYAFSSAGTGGEVTVTASGLTALGLPQDALKYIITANTAPTSSATQWVYGTGNTAYPDFQ